MPRQLSDLDQDEVKFAELLALIETARNRGYQAINSELVTSYWQLGEYINRKIDSAEWGDGVVDELAAALARRYSGLRRFARPNLFRMRQVYEAYRDNKRVSALLRQLPWTHHMLILSQAKGRVKKVSPAVRQMETKANAPVYFCGSEKRRLDG